MNVQEIVTLAASLKTEQSKTPVVRFYSGIEGIKEVYKDTLTIPSGDHMYAFLNPENVHPEIYSWLTTEYVQERIAKKIYAVSFISSKDRGLKSEMYKEQEEKELRETHYVDDFDFPFECEVIIYDGKIAFVNFNPKAELVGIIIEHPVIFQTVKAFYLHYLWKMA